MDLFPLIVWTTTMKIEPRTIMMIRSGVGVALSEKGKAPSSLILMQYPIHRYEANKSIP
jgi:hypothetical protein